MLFDFPYRHALLAAMCLIPAVVSWWSGRSLAARLDDPLLPEHLLVHRRRNRVVLWFAIAGIIVVGAFGNLTWAIPLTIVARSAAGFRLRRALYDERWSFAQYITGMVRLFLAVGGFRLTLAGAPLLVAAAGSLNWIAALAIATLLLAWYTRSADVFRFILGAQPLGESALLARFQAIAAASTAPQPRFEFVDLHGGAIANAVALPSRRRSSVLYTDTLLRLLDPDEAVAITAHEIAHLEYYDAARLRTLDRTMYALIVGSTGVALVARLIPELSLLTLEAVWCAVYIVVLGWIARDRQRNETASDLRAVQLCGDSDALIRALTKVHTFARLPRRWDTQMERAASHPSLARRIRAIRGAAGGSQPPPLTAPEAVGSLGGHTRITFGDSSLRWQESEGVLHVLAYSQLTELRLGVQARGGTRLIAVERGGRRWEVVLDAAETARAQAILDRVDGRLAEPAARSHSTPWLQAAGAIVAVSAMWSGQLVVALVAMGASIRSAAALFAAAGAAALGAAALLGRQMAETGNYDGVWPMLLLLIFGATLLAGAWQRRQDERSHFVNAGVAGLAVFAVVSVAVIVMRGGDAVRLYQASVALPSGAILPLALGAALAIKRRRAWQLAAIPICLVGLMIGIAGSGTFLYAFGRDPFLVFAQPLSIRTLAGPPIADVTLPEMLTDLRLSPHGTRIALMKYTGGARAQTHFSVGAPGSPLMSIVATDLLFLDDERALALSVERTSARLREVTLGHDSVTWELWIDNLSDPHLVYRRGSNRWVVNGMDVDGRTVSVEGTVGTGEMKRRNWKVVDREEAGAVWAIEGDTALRAQRTLGFDPLEAGALNLTMAAMLDQLETRLTRISPSGETQVALSQLETLCANDTLDRERLVCMAYDGVRTHLLAFAPSGGAPQPIGWLGGRFMAPRPAREGWLSGWTMTTTGTMALPAQVAIDLVSRRLVAFPRELRAEEVTAAGPVAAALTHEAASTRVRLYSLDR